MNISIIGAGKVATRLEPLFGDAGHKVICGARNPDKSQLSILEAARQGEVICLAVPFSALNVLLPKLKEHLKNKIVIDVTNPINTDWSPILLGEENSAGEEVARLLPESKVVKAFNTIFADVMFSNQQQFRGQKLTAFVASDDENAGRLVKSLADDIGFAGFYVGSIQNARYLEAMAHLNIAIALSGTGTKVGFAYLY